MGKKRHVFSEQDNADMASVNAYLGVMLALRWVWLDSLTRRWDGSEEAWQFERPLLPLLAEEDEYAEFCFN